MWKLLTNVERKRGPCVCKNGRGARGTANLVELAFAIPVILGGAVFASDALLVRHRLNVARHHLEEVANQARANTDLQADIWTEGRGGDAVYSRFKSARASVVGAAAARLATIPGLLTKPIQHLDRTTDGDIWPEQLQLGYLPPGTSAFIDDQSWSYADLNNFSRCYTSASEASGRVPKNAAPRLGDVVGQRTKCIKVALSADERDSDDPDAEERDSDDLDAEERKHSRKIDVTDPEESLTSLSNNFPTELVAVVAVKGLVSTRKVALSVPFYPINARATGACVGQSCGVSPTPIPTATAVPTPIPTATPKPCYNIAVTDEGDWGKGKLARGNYPACLMQKFRDSKWQVRGKTDFRDDMVACYLYGRGYFHGVNVSCLDNGFGRSFVNNFVSTIDADCQVLKVNNADPICLNGSFGVRVSPLSLIWESGYQAESSYTVVKFPLDPTGSPEQHYEWRASAKAPLVVWDPAGKGEITDATQLFGNNTFGKKWDNGYQALATLDKDQDGEVSGEELKNIALWFDNNRDGISQRGEVRGVTERGVVTLYVTPDRVDSSNTWVHARKGYDRIAGGKTERLPSVDWFAKAHNGLGSARVSGLMNGAGDVPRGGSEATAAAHSKPVVGVERSKESVSAKQQQTAGAADIAGVWLWAQSPKVPSVNSVVGDGILTFGVGEDGAIGGVSLMEVPLQDNPDKAAKAQIAIPLRVKREGTNASGEHRYQTVATDEKTGQNTTSEVILSADRTTLRGKSVEKTPDGALEYEWTAIRLEKPHAE